jgi:hypothetical protein
MRQDGVELKEGTDIKNLTIPSGATFPLNPTDGELFKNSTYNAVCFYDSETGLWYKLIGIDPNEAIYTTSETDSRINVKTAEIVSASPEYLQTINDLKTALTDADAITALTQQIAAKLPLIGGTCSGVIKAPGFEIVSKLSEKDVLGEIPDVRILDAIETTNVTSYCYKNDPTKEVKLGFIADYTDPLLSGENQDKMDVTNCIGALIKTTQILLSKVNALEEALKEK